MADADLAMAVPSVFFGAVGTAGQRCTSTRRLYLQRRVADEFLERLTKLYKAVSPGDPLAESTLIGPLHTATAVQNYTNTIEHLRSIGADILIGGEVCRQAPLTSGNFVQPTISVPKSVDTRDKIWSTEVFAPILNVAVFDELDQAIEWNNAVPQVRFLKFLGNGSSLTYSKGLSSSLWTRDLRNAGRWVGPSGSDAGIVNVSCNRHPSASVNCLSGERRH